MSDNSQSLVLKGIDIDAELDIDKLENLLSQVDDDKDRALIENRLDAIGGVSGSAKMSKKASRSADITGELMPFILGQLQNSLDKNSQSLPSCSSSTNITPLKKNDEKSARSSSEESSSPEEECLFDSGTESGEDSEEINKNTKNKSVLNPPPVPPPPQEFSSFMKKLQHSLSQNGSQILSSLGGESRKNSASGINLIRKLSLGGEGNNLPPPRPPSPITENEIAPPGLIDQVDRVLSVLKDSLVKDPNCLKKELKAGSGSELIALIDRLQSSLGTNKDQTELSHLEQSHCQPDLIPSLKLSELNLSDSNLNLSSEMPWKIRAAAKRSKVRSKSIGVSEEEIAEARLKLQEEAFRSALKDKKESEKVENNTDSPSWKIDFEQRLKSIPRPFVRDLGLIKNSTPKSLKALRTFSLDNYDPSSLLFTPSEVVQFAVHKAAINKQVSDEEERRRKNSLTSTPKILAPLNSPRDFSLTLPKPYVTPTGNNNERQISGSTSENINVNSGPISVQNPRSIENVQISLQESGQFPQLQIAITLNNNRNSGEEQSGLGSSDDSSNKGFRYRSKNERKKKMKRANTLDSPYIQSELDDEIESEIEEKEKESRKLPDFLQNKKMPDFLIHGNAGNGTIKPAFLQPHSSSDKFWNNRFSNLKTSFESSPSVSPTPHVKSTAFRLQQEAPSNVNRPIWANDSQNDTKTQNTPQSSVKNKLSVFEPPITQQNTPIEHHSAPFLNFVSKPQKSSILLQKENFEKKFSENVAAPKFTPHKEETKKPDGVHTIHATKSAIEAMQRQNSKENNVNNVPNSKFPNVLASKALFEAPSSPQQVSQNMQTNNKSSIAAKRTEFENFQKFGTNSQQAPQPIRSAFAPVVPSKKIEMAKNFENVYKNEDHKNIQLNRGPNIELRNPPVPRPVSAIFYQNKEEDENMGGAVFNSPVVSKVMKGPMQQRATFSSREMTSVDSDHPLANRIKAAQSNISKSIFENKGVDQSVFASKNTFENIGQRGPDQGNYFKNLQVPQAPVVKSLSGEALNSNFKPFPTQMQGINKNFSAFKAPESLPNNKNFSEFSKAEPFKNVQKISNGPFGQFQSQHVSTPSIPKSVVEQNIKRTSSGSSIFDRTRSLYISAQDSLMLPKSETPRKIPPSLPKSGNSLFPKQFEATLSSETAVKKQRELEAYFSPKETSSNIPSRYARAMGREGNINKIRKSASQGKIMERRKSMDSDEEDDNVDKIFESLFRASRK